MTGQEAVRAAEECPLMTNGQEASNRSTGNQNDFDTIGDVCDPPLTRLIVN